MTATTTPETTTTTWTIDPTHTLVEFSLKHLMITTVKGRFTEVSGSITTNSDDPTVATADVTIGAASITTGTDARDQHLRSADFFDVEQFPSLTFRATRLDGAPRQPGDEFTVIGELTIRGVTREVALAATFEGTAQDPWGGLRTSFSATTKIDRRDYGLTWNAALESGGVMVSNDIKVSIEVQATRAV